MAPKYEFYVGGPRDGQGLGEWARDMQRRQREVQSQVRKGARDAVADVVREAKSEANEGTKIQKAAGKSVRSEYFKGKPAVKAGGKAQVIKARGKKRPVMAGEIIIGAEFGGYKRHTKPRGGKSFQSWKGSAWQFRPRTPKMGRGNEGNFLWPAVRKHYKAIVEKFDQDLKDIFSK